MIRLNMNENPNRYVLSTSLIKKVEDMDLNMYCSDEILIEKISNFENIEKKFIYLGEGIEELLIKILMIIKIKEENLYLAENCWNHYKILAERIDINYEMYKIEINEDGYYSNLENFINEMTSKKNGIILINSPNNPTGSIISQKKLEYILEKCGDKMVVLDYCYRGFADEAEIDCEYLINKYSNIVILNTFSKYFSCAGVRVGYLLANNLLIQELNKIKNRWGPSIINQNIICDVLDNKNWFIEKNKGIAKRRDNLYALLKTYSKYVKVYKSYANFVYLESKDSEKLNYYLYQNGILVKKEEYGIRITIGSREEMNLVEMYLKKFFEDMK